MFRNNSIPKTTVNVAFNDGGLGDNIARMTAIRYMTEKYPHNNVNLYVPDYFADLAKNLVPALNLNVIKYSDGPGDWDKHPIRMTKNFHDTMRTHLVDHAFHVLCNMQPKEDDKDYCRLNLESINIEKFQLPKDYLIITTGFTAPVREMLPEVINELAEYALSRNWTPVFLGSKQTKVTTNATHDIKGNFKNEIRYDLGINLIDKTNLLEAGKILSGAKAVVGVDNGLLHLAGCTDVQIIGGFTTVNPDLRMPYRHGKLGWKYYAVYPEGEVVKCRFCQSNWDFIYKHDFRNCYYKDYACVKRLTADKYILYLKWATEEPTYQGC